ncbi:MAG: malate:quinone oxidoreductase, partial [Patescibacteria group bacterium]|nr:malate:quinone oxidoreductase [Patescibacteria group bacterium]
MKKVDIVLVGGGIMSATLAMLLHELQPQFTIEIFEQLQDVALESSNAWNNAGTGHSAFCELNYTPQLPDGSIPLTKPVAISESFEISKQFWAYLVKTNRLIDPRAFIHSVPHLSFVGGKKGVDFLRKKYKTLTKHPLFDDMEFTNSQSTLMQWVPLMMEGRGKKLYAATRVGRGTDVNFEALTKGLFSYLVSQRKVGLNLHHEVTNLTKNSRGWTVSVTNRKTGGKDTYDGAFVFIGAGGTALTLLEKSGITEGRGYGGFPVNGNFLFCSNEEIIQKHHAKVYGMPSIGTPPMSVPHLDTRIINGKKELLFGPFAGFSTKFLKHGSYLDFFLSLRSSNILPILSAGAQNIPLTTYLVKQVLLTPSARLLSLHEFYPQA